MILQNNYETYPMSLFLKLHFKSSSIFFFANRVSVLSLAPCGKHLFGQAELEMRCTPQAFIGGEELWRFCGLRYLKRTFEFLILKSWRTWQLSKKVAIVDEVREVGFDL